MELLKKKYSVVNKLHENLFDFTHKECKWEKTDVKVQKTRGTIHGQEKINTNILNITVTV